MSDLQDEFPGWARVRPIFRPYRLIRRRKDGAFFEASDPGYPGRFHWYFFRRIVPVIPGIWKRTGEVWQLPSKGTEDLDAFEVIKP